MSNKSNGHAQHASKAFNSKSSTGHAAHAAKAFGSSKKAKQTQYSMLGVGKVRC